MRRLSLTVVWVLMVLVGGAACSATVPGSAVFVRLTSTADDARSDVYEQRLAGGPARVLISHTKLPKSFRGRIESALPSPDGALVLLEESDGVVIRNKRTGAIRLVLGGGYGGNGLNTLSEAVAEWFSGSYWLWARRSGAVKKITLPQGDDITEQLGWSPRGNLLLLRVSRERKSRTAKHLSELLCVLDGATGKTRTIRTARPYDGLLARWTSDGTAVLMIGERENERASLELVPLTGKVQRLFALPDGAFDAAISPDGRQVAIGDIDGYFLSDRKGRARRKLALPVIGSKPWPEDRHPWGQMLFSHDGGTLAVLVAYSYGHGQGASTHEELWAVQTRSAKAHRLAQWTSGWEGDDDTHVILAWAPGQAALFLVGEGYESRKLWLHPISPAQRARLLLDAGPRGIDIAWWGSLSQATAR